MKRILHWFICLALIVGLCPGTAYAAPEWPNNAAISAEGGILIDAATGVILYGKNQDTIFFPASITKILTALIVIENCDLDDVITFSHNAVYNVESGSTSAGLDVGDQLTVREALYIMVLKSANEVANALAEHTAGSMEDFAEMMNNKAAELGCRNSHFVNPSGLNDPNHYTTAYDMALISQAAYENETFVVINSTLLYSAPITKRNPEGFTVSPGHRMMKKNNALYYPGIIGGKTGYTMLAGNTLVTCAEREGLKLITVVLNGYKTHYEDTKTMLDFGFNNFKSVNIAESDTRYNTVTNDLTIAGLPAADLSIISMQKDKTITLPYNADFADASSSITYDLPADAPTGAVARISYQYGDHEIGFSYLMLNSSGAAETKPVIDVTTEAAADQSIQAAQEESPDEAASVDPTQPTQRKPLLQLPSAVWIALLVIVALAVLTGGIVTAKIVIEKKEESDREARCQRRQQRLKDIGMSPAEFDLLLQERRTTTDFPKKRRRGRKR